MGSREEKRNLETIPVGSLGIIALEGCRNLGEQVDKYLVKWREERESEHKDSLAFAGYQRDSYLIGAKIPRFGSGEAKGMILESVRGDDLYLLVDVCNYSMTYSLCGHENHMSPDDHYQDLKRIIAAVGGKARRITVIMPFLYESRQHKRNSRESLDCALALQELVHMGVDNIITFDAHDPRVQNAIPLHGFETVQPAYQFIKGLLLNVKGLQINSDHMMVISPDEGGMKRAIYIANVLGLDMGMFYKRRDYTRIENGRNPIVAHEFLGSSVEGKDMIIIDDMISSGESVLEVASALKERKARNIFVFSTFGLFTGGLDKFDKAYESGIISRILTTNLIYQTPELLKREWYISCDLSKYIAYIIDTLNHDSSISDLLNPSERIQSIVARYMTGELDKESEAKAANTATNGDKNE
ncbi:MAG: ribose-phosphate pyrophosphokinase [Lachnospiraceae bacterium]|nr:ribose-phosphate pyrophosphokinase [Lachnospiraceae bacterium]